MSDIGRGPVGKARLVFAALLVAGMVAGGTAFAEYRRIQDPLQYEPTPCTIEACQFLSEKTFRGGHAVTLFTPAVRYRYQADGVTYHGDAAAGRPVPLVGEFARQEYENRFAPGEAASCYRDPRNDAVSVLSQDSDRGELDFRVSLAVVVFSLAAVGWGSLEYFLKPERARTPERRGVYTGLPDDVPDNDALARTRALVRDRERGYRP